MAHEKLDRLAVYGGKGFWLRAAYMDGFGDKSITAVVRLGDRSDPANPRNNPIGEDLPVRFIRVPGNQEAGIEPKLFDDDGITVRVTASSARLIRDLTPDDLRGCAPDCTTPELVRYHLATINNTCLPSPNEAVTIFRFEYRPSAR